MKQALNVVVFLPCSDRKYASPTADLCAQNLTTGPVKEVADAWGQSINCATLKLYPNQIYSGRAYKVGQKAAKRLDAELVVISAGYGLVREHDKISPYSLTVSSGKLDSIAHKVIHSNWSPSVWWKTLGERTHAKTNLSTLLAQIEPDLILMSLSVMYACLIKDELRSLNQNNKSRLRLFTVGKNPHIPSNLTENVMPYDSRIDGPNSPIRGTMSDFSSRTLHHFACCIEDGLIDGNRLDEDKAKLLELMTGWTPPNKPLRRRQTDEEIIAFILNAWHQSGGHSSVALRLLRDSGFACEQSRFRNLFGYAVNRRKLDKMNNC